MSENVTNTGQFAILKNPISENRSSELNDLFYENGSTLRINYDGTLVYTVKDDNIEGIKFYVPSSSNITDLISDIPELSILDQSVTDYICTWYNGCDSDMSTLTLNEYKSKINFNN